MPVTTTLASALDEARVRVESLAERGVMRGLGRLAADHDLHVLGTVRLYRIRSRIGEPVASDFRPFDDLHHFADNVVGVWREDLVDADADERGLMGLSVLRGPGTGRVVGRVAHLLDRRLVANVTRGVPDGPLR